MEDIASDKEYEEQKRRAEKDRLERMYVQEQHNLENEHIKSNIVLARQQQKKMQNERFASAHPFIMGAAHSAFSNATGNPRAAKVIHHYVKSKTERKVTRRRASAPKRRSSGFEFGAGDFYGGSGWLGGGRKRKKGKGVSLLGGGLFG